MQRDVSSTFLIFKVFLCYVVEARMNVTLLYEFSRSDICMQQ